MSSIGFRSSTLDELEVLAAMAIEDGAPMFTSDGTYFAWSDKSGAELWAQRTAGEEFLGVNPHFKHEMTTRLRIESLRRRRTDSAMERLASAWVEDDSHPVLFDVPDAGAYRSLPLPTVADVQLVAFAHSIAVSETSDHRLEDLRLAPQAFLPIGQFGDGKSEPQGMALFTGFVDSSETRTNRQANREFRVMTVRTLAFTVPVVFDPELAPEPGVGASVMVEAWLSGRMPSVASFGDEAPRARGRLSRLLGR